jgi:hypothetical protein
MAENKTLPLKHGGTHLAYITDEEEKILRDLFHSKETDPEVKYFNGVPVLEGEQQEMEEQAAAQKLYNKQKAAGWQRVPTEGGGSEWVPPTTKKAAPKKAVVDTSGWKGVSYETWKDTGQYPDGTKFNPKDKELPGYYENYKAAVTEANESGNIAHKKEIERQHGQIDTGTATESEKKGYVEYVLGNPDLRENAEALGLTQQEMAEFGQIHFETFGVGQYIYDAASNMGVYNRNLEDRANYLRGAAELSVSDPEAFKRTLNISDSEFQKIIRDYGSATNWLYQGGDTSRMWEARDTIATDFGGSPWDLANFNAIGWNMDPDNPYARAIRAGTIDVAEDVGQLLDTGNVNFLQDRYEDNYRANDFPGDWVTDGVWTGPPDLGEYWNAISTAVRDPNTGEISSTIPSTDWTTYGTTGGGGGGILAPWVDPNISGSPSTAGLLEYRPWEADYWATYLPEQMDQITMGAPVVEPSMAYQPGEFRDPATWRAVLDAPGDLMERIPAGGWVNDPARWPSSASPWAFTSPGGGTNIAQNMWGAPSLSSADAQKWAGLLADLDASPAIDTSTQSLLGV